MSGMGQIRTLPAARGESSCASRPSPVAATPSPVTSCLPAGPMDIGARQSAARGRPLKQRPELFRRRGLLNCVGAGLRNLSILGRCPPGDADCANNLAAGDNSPVLSTTAITIGQLFFAASASAAAMAFLA